MKKSNDKSIVGFQIFSIILSVFAFSFIISSSEIVGATSSLPSLSNFLKIGKYKAGELVDSKGNVIGSVQDNKWLDTKGNVMPEEAKAAAQKAGATPIAPWKAAGSGVHALSQGITWAGYAYVAGQFVGSMLGISSKNTAALSTSLAAGAGIYQAISTYSTGAETGIFSQTGWVGGHAGAIGVGVAALVFISTYKDEKIKTVEFNCMPWQAPTGGENCEVCNDGSLPCSEYRCRSLGQGCEIVNSGTEEEKCVYVNPQDVNPPIIKPNYEELSSGYAYKNVKTSPPGPGFEIINTASNNGCLKAFSPLEFGLTLNEPAQCKIDINHTESFDEMRAYIGGSNLYLYNHSERLNIPGTKDLTGSGFILENGKDLTFFMRCQDKNGNTNDAEYALHFCIDPSPDTTAPEIMATSVANDGCVAEDITEAEVVFYVNEPATCKWGTQDSDYDLMTNEMVCQNSYSTVNSAQLFGCKTTLTGISRESATYYVRCKDQPSKEEKDRNVNRESFKFSLKGSSGLVMKNLRPNTTVFGGVSPAPIELYAETIYGCENGRAVCLWSSDGEDYVEFFDTNNEDGINTQRLDLEDGAHTIYVRCIDAGGNVAEDVTEFNVDIETNAPVIARVYEEDGMLKVVTVRDSECSYKLDNCDFTFNEGTEMPYGNTTTHVTEWSEENTYYIKCRDEFLNEEADCSLVVRPTANFL